MDSQLQSRYKYNGKRPSAGARRYGLNLHFLTGWWNSQWSEEGHLPSDLNIHL